MKKIAFLVTAAALIAGCSQQPTEYPTTFEPNLVHAWKYQIKEGIPMEQASEDTFWIIREMFGTPDQPRLPEVLKEEGFTDLVSMDRLVQASGPVSEGRGLYRKHCISCHGATGNGRGKNSAILDPYPRDYRHGIFKFKSTERGAKPTREDLAETIRDGIAGTSMKKIPELTEDDVQALVDYVIYLSVRGELERALIDDAIFNLDLGGGDRIIDRQFGESLRGDGREQVEAQIAAWKEAGEPEGAPGEALEEKLDLYDESREIAEDIALDIADGWLEAEDEVVEVPEPPADIPVTDSYEQFAEIAAGDQADALVASIQRGREVFLGKVASCSKCHGKKGEGDGQTNDYDDWTKDWTTRVGLKPEDTDALVPLMARGALPPKNAKPRNFTDGIFRGGGSAADLYHRISQGIEGTPMPAATFVEGDFEQQDIWHLINFIRSLQQPEST